MYDYRKFNYLLIGTVLLSSLLIPALVNFTVDPYGFWGTPAFYKFNLSKPTKLNHERLFKAAQIMRIRPKVVFLGTSRALFGLDPDYFLEITGSPAYNLALTSASIYEELRYLEHATFNQRNLDQVIIGLDFFSFNGYGQNKNDFVENRLTRSTPLPEDIINTLYSFDALIASQETIRTNLLDPDFQTYNQNGKITEQAIKRLKNKPAKDLFEEQLSSALNKGSYSKFSLDSNKISNLHKIVQLCRDKNIDLKMFISPSHATQWEAIRSAGLWSDFENWKREIVKVAPVWDFSGYNSITTEPLKNNMKYYWDSSHYRKEVGNMVINKLFNRRDLSTPPDFGILITTSNIDEHLTYINSQRKTWAEINPDLVSWVKHLKKK